MKSKLGPLMQNLVASAASLTGRGSLMGATAAIQRAIGDALVPTARPISGKAPPAPETTGAPAKANAPGESRRQFAPASFTHAGEVRDYKLFRPSGREGRALPLVVMLHGCTQDADDFAAGTRMNALAQAEGFFVLYPNQPRHANASKCWNWFQPGHQRRGAGEPALLAAMTLHVIATEAVDADRVYVAGLSAGGAMAAILAGEYPDVYAAAGVHSGLPSGAAHDLGSALAAMKGSATDTPRPPSVVPTIVFHGDDDATVHPSNGERVIRDMRLASSAAREGSAGRDFTRTVHRDPSGKTIAELWQVHGAGHAWSGGSPNGSYTEAAGPDATAEMLRFFLEHPRQPG